MGLPWRVEMFGGLRVVQTDRTVTRFQTQKTGALLAYLALHLQASHGREELAELLWPGGDPIAVRNRLNQAVSSLRRQLEPPPLPHGSVMATDQRSIRLLPEAIVTDVDEFQHLCAKAEGTDAATERKPVLKRAVDLYVGEFLAGSYTDWATMEQLRFADLYSSALYDLLDVCRETGDLELAVQSAIKILKTDPSDEGTHCDLMRLYLDLDRPAAAKRQFEELSRILAQDDEQPSEEAYDLNREATQKRSQAAKSVIAEAQPTQSNQEVATIPEGVPENKPSLPSSPNRFIGRDSDLFRLTQMLRDPTTRMVSILGIGGCGKTRLALQAARQLSDEFGGNAFFVALADTAEESRVEEQIAASAGIRGSENIVRRLQQNDRTLLVLDNFEQIAEGSAPAIQTLLESAPTLKCLVTSRRPLHIDSERCFPLSPLMLPSDVNGIDELAENPSVALFVDRAQAVLPDFQLTQRNAEIVGKICQRLEGLPLAIELVASWAKTVAPGQMLAMLSDRFTLLESRRRDITARHRTMRAVIDSCVGLLPADLPSVLFRLSVFQGGWTLESAAFVCGKPTMLAATEELTEQSLIQSDDLNPDAMRYRMLDTLRDYAREHLTTADRAEAANLHAEYFSNLAEEYKAGQGWATSDIEDEFGNLSAAFDWYLANGLTESALRLANALSGFWELRGRANEGRQWYEKAFARFDPADKVDPTAEAIALNKLARLIWIQGDFAAAVGLHDKALKAWKQLGDAAGIIDAQFNIQMEAHRTRAYDESIVLLNDNLERSIAIGDKNLQSRCYLALGNTFVELRKPEKAKSLYEQSLKIARQAGNQDRVATALSNLGNLATLTGQHDLAREYLAEAVAGFEAVGSKRNTTDAYLHFAKLERRANQIDASLEWQERVWANRPEETYHIQALFLEQAFVAAARGNRTLAASFLGFVDRQSEEYGGLNLDVEQDEYRALVNEVKEALPIDEFLAAWSLGQSWLLPKAAAKRVCK